MSKLILDFLSLYTFKFSMRFLLLNQHKIESVLSVYQNDCRIYLDEYPGQKDRLKIYKKNRLRELREISDIIGAPYICGIPRPDIFKLLAGEKDD